MNAKRIATMILWVGLAAGGYADHRSYVWTYEYLTMPAGTAEVEYYFTAKVPDSSVSKASTWEHWGELEYGLTDNWDLSLYQTWKQSFSTNASSFKYEGFKLRTRYKLFKSGAFLVDPVLYLEYIRKAGLEQANVLEGKLIVARDIGKVNLAYNAIVKSELESGGETEHEYAAGMNYDLPAGLSVGLESKGNYTENKYALGPTVSVETGPFWVTAGAVLGLNERTEDVQARMLAGFGF
ncbi:MAG: hypothetical protein HYV36_01745 [Lentisphaerae bacterium]|nr:hypothetical protein [Lentisphaerota bacterium]